MHLPFPYGEVRGLLDRAWSDPTPLGGVARSSSRARADASPVRPRPGALLFLGGEHRFLDLGRDGARLLEEATRRGTSAAADLLGPEHRATALRFLARAWDHGLIVEPGEEPALSAGPA